MDKFNSCYRVVDSNNVPLGDVGPSRSGTVGEVGQTVTDTDLLCPTCGFSTDKPSTYRSHIEQHNKQQTYVCVSALCVIHTKHLPYAVAYSSPILFVCNNHYAVLFMTVGVESACLFGVTRKKAWHTYRSSLIHYACIGFALP